jgi:hypothetical protein
MHAGITAGNPNADLIAWDWGWRKLPWKDTEKNILDSINKDIIYISDFEIGGKRSFPREQNIYEYSLGYPGPSESFSELTTYARNKGRRVGAKLQVGTTHEIASVPNLPLIHNLWKKVRRAQELGTEVAFATWNLGTYQTMNTYLFGHAFQAEQPVSWKEFLELACNYLEVPAELASYLENAWKNFETAMQYFPFCVPMLYQGPINYSPSYWMPPTQAKGTDMGMSCHLTPRGDNLGYCCGNYSLEEVIELFGKLTDNWLTGLTYIEELKNVLTVKSSKFMQEYYNAKCIYHVYKSTLNVFRAYSLCRNWHDFMMPEYIKICEDELNNCKALLPLLAKDKRLGMHLECKGYMFDAGSVSGKINLLEKHLQRESILEQV